MEADILCACFLFCFAGLLNTKVTGARETPSPSIDTNYWSPASGRIPVTISRHSKVLWIKRSFTEQHALRELSQDAVGSDRERTGETELV